MYDDPTFFHMLTRELGGDPDSTVVDDGSSTTYDVLLTGLHEDIPITLRRQGDVSGQIICYARLGEALKPRTLRRLLSANVRMIPRRMWFAYEHATCQVVVSYTHYRGGLSVDESSRRVRGFASALGPWRDAVAVSEGDGQPPPEPRGPETNEPSGDGQLPSFFIRV
ncbi:hypothetical protein DB346_12810 [Verrucomicrobia bacterium LW23]|nr:hypothetical protein DB346_12810 [Verrucomicrobia bacterium LW23]